MNEYLQQKLEDLKNKNLLRVPKGAAGGFINFTSNDYLGLSRHPQVVATGVAAAEKYGAGAGASRIAGGEHPLFAEFAAAVAAHKGYEAATIFGSGYLANLGVITALEPEIIYADKLVHACIIDAARLSGARLVRFRHNDMEDLRRLLLPPPTSSRREEAFAPFPAGGVGGARGLIITEEIFSMDGDSAPLAELRQIADEHGCTLIVDGAHSLYDKKPKIADIYIGTMSKALGSYGGYVCGSRVLVEYLETKARPLIYSTGLPPFAVGAALKSLEIAETEKLYLKTLDNSKYLTSSLRGERSNPCWSERGGLLRSPRHNGLGAIVPIILGSEEKALAAEQELRRHKILVSAIRPPTVPKGTSRLRISVTAEHDKSEIDLLAEKLKYILCTDS